MKHAKQVPNPKDVIGSTKLPMHLWPPVATAHGSLALLHGALKYGKHNFRKIPIKASVYLDAIERHTGAYRDGEDNDPDSGLIHLAHLLACGSIMLEAISLGKFIDDRPKRGNYDKAVRSLTPHVKRLIKLHKNDSPKHYLIND